MAPSQNADGPIVYSSPLTICSLLQSTRMTPYAPQVNECALHFEFPSSAFSLVESPSQMLFRHTIMPPNTPNHDGPNDSHFEIVCLFISSSIATRVACLHRCAVLVMFVFCLRVHSFTIFAVRCTFLQSCFAVQHPSFFVLSLLESIPWAYAAS